MYRRNFFMALLAPLFVPFAAVGKKKKLEIIPKESCFKKAAMAFKVNEERFSLK